MCISSSVREFTIVFGEDLVALFLFHQIVELGELEITLIIGRIDDAANVCTAGFAVHGANDAKAGTGQAKRHIAARIGEGREAAHRVFRDVGNRPVFLEQRHFILVLVACGDDEVPVTPLLAPCS